MSGERARIAGEDSPDDIQRCLHCEFPDCYNCLDHHYTGRSVGRPGGVIDPQRLVRLYNAKCSQKQMAAAFHVDARVVVSYLRSRGIPTPFHPNARPHLTLEMLQEHEGEHQWEKETGTY